MRMLASRSSSITTTIIIVIVLVFVVNIVAVRPIIGLAIVNDIVSNTKLITIAIASCKYAALPFYGSDVHIT